MPDYISREAAIIGLAASSLTPPQIDDAAEALQLVPTEDVVPVVRCRECKNYRPWGKVYERKDYTGLCIVWSNMSVHKEDYCSHAVRKSKEGGKKNDK